MNELFAGILPSKKIRKKALKSKPTKRCVCCIVTKMKLTSSRGPSSRVFLESGKVLFMDYKFHPNISTTGHKYDLTVTCERSFKPIGCSTLHRDDVINILPRIILRSEAATGNKCICIRCDGASEFVPYL